MGCVCHTVQCLFLHADTQLPVGFEQLISSAVAHRQQKTTPAGRPAPLHVLYDCWQYLWHQQSGQQQQPCERRESAAAIRVGRRRLVQHQHQPQPASGQQAVCWGCFNSIQLDQVGSELVYICRGKGL